MPRKGENIYKRKDGRWEGRFIKEYGVNCKALYGYVYGKTYNEVRQKLRKAQVKELSPPLPNNQSATTYNDLLKLWLASVQINVKEGCLQNHRADKAQCHNTAYSEKAEDRFQYPQNLASQNAGVYSPRVEAGSELLQRVLR